LGKKALQNLDFLENGIAICPASPVTGDEVKIQYDGILSKNGANEIILRLGYGNNWDNEQYIPMVKRETCFEVTVPALKEDYMKLSFIDSNNNVDDNSGNGYSIDIIG